MAERLSNPEEAKSSSQSSPELKVEQSKTSSTEQLQATETQAEKAERQAADRLEQLKENKVETKTEKLSEKTEKNELKAERQPKVEKETKPTKAQRKTAFNEEISSIRAHLTPAQARLSRVVHNRVVESASQALEETVFRPSLVLGGAVGALIVGGGFYVFAKVRGYPVTGSEFIVGLIVGGGLGLLAELLWRMVSRRPKP